MKKVFAIFTVLAILAGLSGCDMAQTSNNNLPLSSYDPEENYADISPSQPSSKEGFSADELVEALNRNLAGSFDPIPYSKNFTYMNCATCSLTEQDGIVTEVRTKISISDLCYFMPNKEYKELEAFAGTIVTKPLHLTAFPEENLVYIYSTLLNNVTSIGGLEIAECKIGDWYCQLQIVGPEYQFVAIKN